MSVHVIYISIDVVCHCVCVLREREREREGGGGDWGRRGGERRTKESDFRVLERSLYIIVR